MNIPTDRLQAAANLIRQSRYTIALTGAGISTASGIPDFRSPGSGLWRDHDPMDVASLNAFRINPHRFFEWVRPLAGYILQAKPNPAHYALTRLQQSGYLQTIITQNIDSLHQDADSNQVIEVHGHMRTVTCARCYRQQNADQYLAAFLKSGEIPTCDCGRDATLKPDVILFGEQLPIQAFTLARQEMTAAELIIVVGSSLEVAPISDLPSRAIHQGTHLMILNYQPTHMDQAADLVIHADVTSVLPQISDLVLAADD